MQVEQQPLWLPVAISAFRHLIFLTLVDERSLGLASLDILLKKW